MKNKQCVFASSIVFIIFSFFVGPTWVQAWDGDYFITSSADIVALAGHTEVTGRLLIASETLINLSGLESLTSVGGDLYIVENDVLTSLQGLEGLTSVGGLLSIYKNCALTSLTGINNLTNVRGLYAAENDVLISLDGLGSLTSVSGNLNIWENDALTNLTGLNNLISVGGHLGIGINHALTSLTGLNKLTSVGAEVSITANYDLTSLSALSNLTSVGGDLYIGENDALTSLTGLEGVINLGGILSINNNDSLTSLDGLNNLTSVGGYVVISENDVLATLNGLNNLTSVNGTLSIIYNDALTSIRALSNLTSMDGYLAIVENDALTSLRGLEGITNVSGNLVIGENDALISLSGLEGITSVSGNLYIGFHEELDSLSGLNNIASVGGLVAVVYNNDLTNLCDLYNAHVAGDKLFIYDNSVLSENTALELETQLRSNGFTGSADIYDNFGTGLVDCSEMIVSLDIKPGSDPNCTNVNEQGVIPVAIFGSPELDVKNVNPASLVLQGLTVKTVGKSNKYLSHYEHVNADGVLDLVVQFEDSDTWVDTQSGLAVLTGALYDGTQIGGTDSLCIVPLEPTPDSASFETTSDICSEDAISDHVSEIEIKAGFIGNTVYWYDDGLHECWFDIKLYTDSSVKKVSFLTPAGNLYEFDAVDEVSEETNDGWIAYGREEGDEPGVYELFYWGEFNNLPALHAFSDGNYIVTVYYDNGCFDQTTFWFGVPGTNNPVGQPVQIPLITNFSDGDTFSSPIMFEWTPYKGRKASLVGFGWENDYEENDRFLPIDTSALPEPLALDVGGWTIELGFHVWHTSFNGDGIKISAGKYSQSEYGIYVE